MEAKERLRKPRFRFTLGGEGTATCRLLKPKVETDKPYPTETLIILDITIKPSLIIFYYALNEKKK